MSWNPKAQAQRQLAAIAAQGRRLAPNKETLALAAQAARAEADRQEAIRQVTARLKEGLPGKASAGQWGGGLSGVAATLWAKSVAAQIKRPSMFGRITGRSADTLIFDDIVDYKTEPASDDMVDAMKYAMSFWSMPILKPESIVKVDIT